MDGLLYIYNQGIAHRDLKPENLLFDKNFDLKMADFGFATVLSKYSNPNEYKKLKTYCGTRTYMAPEINLRLNYNGTAVDLFASGVILFIMCA